MIAALETRALGKRYRSSWALRDCSLTLPRGCVAALVGPNGAGKTTLLRLVMSLTDPTCGDVEVLGVPGGSTALGVLARVAFVAQETPLYGDFSVADMLRFGRHLNRTRWDDSKAGPRLQALGIPLDQRVGRLSGGQRAQVALALALAKRPELLLLDEPLASLDPLARRQFLQVLMEEVALSGVTVLLSSHIIADLERVCDHLILLSAGQVQVAGGIEDLLGEHRVLTGPRRAGAGVPPLQEVVDVEQGARQSTYVVRSTAPVLDPRWEVSALDLEELVLAYLRRPATGALPPPVIADREGAPA